MAAWEKAYLTEIKHYADIIKGKRIKSIFFGGGTPSLASPGLFGSILNELNRLSTFDENIEITIEANPTSVEASKFKAFADIGINRASIGVQSLDDKNLKFLGREHNVKEALQAIELAGTNFPRYSFDLIYTLPNQGCESWLEELEKALTLAGGHLSLYQLTIEKGTQFYKDFKAKVFTMPDDEISADFYIETTKRLASHGYNRYEVSNYAKQGHECQHNLTYWKYEDFIGIGPGAHGRYHKDGEHFASVKIYSPEQWCDTVDRNGVGLQKLETLSKENIVREKLIMGMRLKDGVSLELVSNHKHLKELLELGLISVNSTHLKATDQGFLVLNSVIEKLAI